MVGVVSSNDSHQGAASVASSKAPGNGWGSCFQQQSPRSCQCGFFQQSQWNCRCSFFQPPPPRSRTVSHNWSATSSWSCSHNWSVASPWNPNWAPNTGTHSHIPQLEFHVLLEPKLVSDWSPTHSCSPNWSHNRSPAGSWNPECSHNGGSASS